MLRIIQLGKNGITENFIESLKNQFKSSRIVKISVLKSATRDREQIKKFRNEILEKFGKKLKAKIIGFTIILRR